MSDTPIGHFNQPIAGIELMVKPGNTIAVDQSLITVILGDKVAEGSVVLQLKASISGSTGSIERKELPVQTLIAQLATKNVTKKSINTPNSGTTANYSGSVDLKRDLLVLGAGPGGYSAAFRAADLASKWFWSDGMPPSAEWANSSAEGIEVTFASPEQLGKQAHAAAQMITPAGPR